MKKIGILDYGSGNVRSVKNALRFLKIDFFSIQKPENLEEMSHIILPGVGSYPALMQKLSDQGFIEPLKFYLKRDDVYYLGICVGMQILSERGEEFGDHRGLGLIEGVTRKIDLSSQSGLKLPHIGWHRTTIENKNSPLFHGIDDSPFFYFIHSFHVDAADPSTISSTCTYGERVTASIEKGRLFGVQFHPEKSQRHGLKLLDNFCSLEG